MFAARDVVLRRATFVVATDPRDRVAATVHLILAVVRVCYNKRVSLFLYTIYARVCMQCESVAQ